jgi:enoyl-CoA hydratase/carnithine racemase
MEINMPVDYEKQDRIAYVTLNRREAFNALDPTMLHELTDVLVDLRDDDDILVGIITGTGQRSFCAGADVKATIPFLREKVRGEWWRERHIMRGLELWKPMIAAVNGLALGGGLELALACDLRIAAENARFGVPEVKLGLIPGWGGTQRLPRAIGLAKAAEMLFFGEPIDAEEAFRIGLINKVVPKDDLMPTATEWAERLCQLPPLAVRGAKEAMLTGLGMSLEQGLKLESKIEDFLVSSEDCQESCAAFQEKRKPELKGK